MKITIELTGPRFFQRLVDAATLVAEKYIEHQARATAEATRERFHREEQKRRARERGDKN